MIEVCKHTLTGYYFSYLIKDYIICQQAYSSILGIQQVPLSVVCDPPSHTPHQELVITPESHYRNVKT